MRFAEGMLIEDNPFPTNMIQHKAGSVSTARDDPANVKTVAKVIQDTVHLVEVKPKPADNVVIKVGDVECSAGRKDSHLRTYKPKDNVVDGEWHDGHKDPQPCHIPKPAVTFGQLLAKYERLRRVDRRRAQQQRTTDTSRTGNTGGFPIGPGSQYPFWLFCMKEGLFPLPQGRAYPLMHDFHGGCNILKFTS